MRASRVFVWIPLIALGCGTAPLPFELTPTEIASARALAESQEPLREIDQPASQPRVVFIKTELLPDHRAGTGQRQVMTQHYRYRDDVTVFTRVDLQAGTVLDVEAIPHYPTGLAPEETTHAKNLAANDVRLATMIEVQNLRMTPRPLQMAPGHPLHGHRLVRLLLQRGEESLSEPFVLVDLTEGKVIVGEPKATR